MVHGKKVEGCPPPCCRVESVVSIDERGQMVLPKEVRKKVGLKSGDKMALIVSEGANKSSCIVLMKVDEIAGVLRNALGPILKDIIS